MPRFLGIAAIIAVALPGSGLAQVSSLTDSVTRVLPGEPASFNLGAGTDAGVEPAVAHLLSASLTFGAVDSLSPSSLGGRRLAPMEEIRLASRVAETATRPDRETAALPRSESKDGCFLHSRPAPACRFFGVTEFGVAFGRNSVTVPPGSDVFVVRGDQTALGSRVSGDLGIMWNIGPLTAMGVSWFVTTDFIGGTGPAVRYRRWLTDKRSLDLAVGVPVAVSNPYPNTAVGPQGIVLGLVKYNPVPWMGIAVRPEIAVRRIAYDCATHPCVGITERVHRVLVGIDFNAKPGAIISATAWGLFSLFALAGGS